MRKKVRKREREREKSRMIEGKETEKSAYTPVNYYFSTFNTFHASTGSVSYRFEGTEDDFEIKAIIQLPHKKTKHLDDDDDSELRLLLFLLLTMKLIIRSCLSNGMKDIHQLTRTIFSARLGCIDSA